MRGNSQNGKSNKKIKKINVRNNEHSILREVKAPDNVISQQIEKVDTTEEQNSDYISFTTSKIENEEISTTESFKGNENNTMHKIFFINDEFPNATILSCPKPYKVLKYGQLLPSEIGNLTRYVRKELFFRMKFVTNSMFEKYKITELCFQQINITDPEEKLKKQQCVIKIVKDTMNSRRGYASQLLTTKLSGKL
jgi:hypothetical protein